MQEMQQEITSEEVEQAARRNIALGCLPAAVSVLAESHEAKDVVAYCYSLADEMLKQAEIKC